MDKLNRYLALSAAMLAVLFVLSAHVGAAQTGPGKAPAAATTYYMRAQVIPAEYTAVGASVTGGSEGTKAGASLWANGINSNWLTGDYTIYFAVFVFSSAAETGKVEFKVISPSKATVYSYSFPSEQVPAGEDWFTFAAKANYSSAGLYFAEWYFNGNLDGWTPLNFSA